MGQYDSSIQKAYVAFFNRPADFAGLAYWNEPATKAGGVAPVLSAFGASSEYAALYAGKSTNAVIETIYQNIFNRAAEPDALSYWGSRLSNGTFSLGQIANAIFVGAQNADATTVANKVTAATAFTTGLDLSAEILGYETLSAEGVETVKAWLKAVTNDAATIPTAGSVTAILATVVSSSPGAAAVFTTTNGTDVASANIFNADQVYTPGGNNRINSLQDEDRLTGKNGTADDVLNATLGNANDNGATTITPKLTSIEVVNVAFTGSGATAANQLDLQDSTGVTSSINITRISDGVATATIDNIAAVPAKLTVANSGQTGQNVSFAFQGAAVTGLTDVTEVALSNVNLGDLAVQGRGGNTGGIETINLASNGNANVVQTLTAQDVKTLNISGAQNLNLHGVANIVRAGTATVEATQFTAGLVNVAGSLTTIDASKMVGNLTIGLGAEIDSGLDNTSGVSVQAKITGGKGNDTFVLTTGANVGGTATNTDIIDGGEGNNTLVMVGNSTVAAAATANVRNIQALEVRTGHDDFVVPDAVTVNASAFDKLATVFIRNEGQALVGTTPTSASEVMTVTLNNLTAAQATGITVAHGTTGNSTIVNNIVNLAFATAGVANASQVTIVDGINNNPVFNLNLTATSSELVTIVDSDTESNTVLLNQGTYTSAGSTITLKGGAAGQYMNLDTLSTGAAVAAAAINNGYGQFTDSTAANNTTVLTAASAALVAGGGIATRDAAVSSVFYGTAGAAGDNAVRHVVENVAAGDYAGNVEIRVGDVTRADGVTSQTITTGVGNDTVIFDAIGATNAGFTSGDTVAMGKGNDTLVIDGNTATIPGTPRIDIQTSEWDNLTGVDALRFGSNAGVVNVGNGVQVANAGGGYYARIDNDFITQTDTGNRLTVINNDGNLTTNTESDLVLDLRGLSQSKFVTFVGANSNGVAAISSNRIVLDDISANQNMILNGGDTDVRVTTTVGYVAGNNNVYEVRNTGNVSISDLAQTSNFGLINFTNDQATAQTLTLTLNNTVVEALVDSSNTAASAATQEILRVVATDNGGIASALNIDARALTGFHALNVTGSNIAATGNDVLTLNSNVGGSVNIVDLGVVSLGDRVNWTGGSATTTVTINQGLNTHQFVDGAVTTTHSITGSEIVDLSGLTYASSVIGGSAAAETFVGGAGVDVMTGGAGADTFVIGNTGSGITVATADSITDFVAGTDFMSLGVAATATNATFVAAAAANFAAALTAANAAFAADAGGAKEYYIGNDGANTFVFIDNGADGVAAEQVVVLTGVIALTVADIIA